MNLRKDETLSTTIDKIKYLLKQVGIQTHITFLANPISFIYSCRVEIQGLPGSGANGKGISETAALASAYSELMERLQNRIFMKSLYMAFNNDYKWENFILQQKSLIQTEDFLNDCFSSKKMPENIANFIIGEEDISFTNIMTGEEVYLNNMILNHYLGSNGMCAGNTYEEALAQGFCEIMERFVLQNLYSGNVADKDISVIPRCCYQQYKIYEVIDELEGMGFICKVLNCSLGGKFPVAGFLIINPHSLRGKFALGCDYDLEIALQRCVTELFQGKESMIALRYNMHSIFDEIWNENAAFTSTQTEAFFSALRDWQGTIPKILLTDYENGDLLPFTDVRTSKEAYELCVSCLGTQHELLVHDASFLGFPAYRIIVRGLSMVNTSAEDYRKYCSSLQAVSNIANSLKSKSDFSEQDLMKLTALQKVPRYEYLSIYDLMGICLSKDYPNITLSEHLAQLHYLKEQYGLSERHLKNSQRKIDMFRSEVIHGKSCGWDDDQIDHLFYEVSSEYRMKTLIYEWIAEGIACFPHCPDCVSCGLSSDCKYEDFKRISYRLDKAYLLWKEENHV